MTPSSQGTGSAPHRAHRRSIITRTFDVARELMFKMWTDPEHFKRWWGPTGGTIGSCDMDPRVGGSVLYSVRMPGGPETWGKFVYRDIMPPERLVFVSSFSDEQGNLTRAPFSPLWPLEIENTLSLSEQFGNTNLTFLGEPVNASPEEWNDFESHLESLHKGFSGTFDRLARYLTKV
jgi:uncharacterized protein YndB with AHSA1/START domain